MLIMMPYTISIVNDNRRHCRANIIFNVLTSGGEKISVNEVLGNNVMIYSILISYAPLLLVILP